VDRDAAAGGLTHRGGDVERLVDGREQVHRLPSSSGSPSFGSAAAAPALLPERRRRRARQSEGRSAAACKAEGEGAAACEAEGEGAAAVAAVRVGDCWVKLRNDHTVLPFDELNQLKNLFCVGVGRYWEALESVSKHCKRSLKGTVLNCSHAFK